MQQPGVEKKVSKQNAKASGQEMTRAMRKMLQLKAAASGVKAAPGKPGAAKQRNSGGGGAVAPAASPDKQSKQQADISHAAGAATQQQQQRQQDHAQPAAPHVEQQQQQQRKQQQQGWQHADHKRLKDRKREFLKQKKLKKKGRTDPLLTEKEAQLAAAAAASAPAFGEQAYQPLKVQLKRRHWAGEGEQAASASKRCTEIFKRQMAEAARAAAAAEAARDDGAAAAVGQQQRPRPQGGKKAKAAKAKAQHGAPDEAVRQQLIDAYRQQKQLRLEAAGKVPLLSATAQSLADLVAREARAAAQR